MLRSIVLFVLVSVAALAVPAIYEGDKHAVGQWLSLPSNEDEASGRPTRVIDLAVESPVEPEPAALLGRKVRLEADTRGHFIADFKLNGRSIPAMIDTGATTVAINESTARRIGLRLKTDDYRDRVNTANGVARAASVVIDRLQVGRISVDNVDAVVLDDSALRDTLIGMSFLNRLSSFQFENKDLVLAQ